MCVGVCVYVFECVYNIRSTLIKILLNYQNILLNLYR